MLAGASGWAVNGGKRLDRSADLSRHKPETCKGKLAEASTTSEIELLLQTNYFFSSSSLSTSHSVSR